METTPAASLDSGKEQGNRSVDARSKGQAIQPTLGYLSPGEFEQRAAHSTSGVH
jgi:hypothetical protein